MHRMSLSPKAIRYAVGCSVVAAILAMVAYVYIRDPSKEPVTFCVFRISTGLYCPGCGMTRAIHELLHLHPLRALHQNAVLLPMMPFLGYMMVAELANWVLGRQVLPSWMPKTWVIVSCTGLLVLFAVLRNIPYFSFLAPF